MSDAGFPLPPPSFEFLVLSLKMQAEMQLGLMNFGPEKEAEPDLRAARHAIDMLAMMAEKTRGNLDMEEQRLVENSLTELRFRYVQVSESAAKAAAAAAATPVEASGATADAPVEPAPETASEDAGGKGSEEPRGT
jgi:hypothetical protein